MTSFTNFFDPEVDTSTEVDAAAALTAGYASVASVTLAIPTHWGGWKCLAHATYVLSADGASTDTINTKLTIDGTDQNEQGGVRAVPSEAISCSIGGRRTGMTTTGNRTVSLQMQAAIPDTSVYDIFLYARAVRTS